MIRGQASLFDGIFFLLIATSATGLIFYFMSSYGTSADMLMTDAYTVNSVQAALKSLYWVDFDSVAASIPGAATGYREDVMSCLKRSVEAGDVGSPSAPSCGAYAKDAMIESLRKTMIIFTQSGYDYMFAVRKERPEEWVTVQGDAISSVCDRTPRGQACVLQGTDNCDSVTQKELSAKLISIAAPFRIKQGDEIKDYAVFLCVWRR